MKKMIRSLSLLIVLIITVQIPFIANAQTTKSAYTGSTYTHQSVKDGYSVSNGIDVSYHNGTVNWTKVKNDGIDFVFIRVGYRGYGSSGSLNEDINYKENIEGALSAGLQVGVYFYSQALNTSEAKEEAKFVLSRISNYDITLPVAFDYEFADVSTGRLDSAWKNKTITKASMTNNALAFCKAVEDAGYDAMVYANASFFSNQLDHAAISEQYDIWLAAYMTNYSDYYSGEVDYWQYSSSGTVSGISGNTDVNFRYVKESNDVSVTVSNKTYTGKALKPAVTVKYKGKALTAGSDYTLSYKNNVNVGIGSVMIQSERYSAVSGTYTFKIVPPKTSLLKLKSRSGSGITLTWNKITGAEGYQVQVYKNGKWNTFAKTSKTVCTVTGLKSATSYKFRIRGYLDAGGQRIYGRWSDVLTKSTKPVKVTGVKVSSRTASSLKLTWNAQSNATGYYVYRMKGNGSEVLIKTVKGGTKNSVSITGLSAGTLYQFRVQAYKTDDKTLTGNKSAVLSAVTNPKQVSSVTTSSSGTKKIAVSWKTVKCSGYQIQYSKTKDFSSDVASVQLNQSGKSATVLNVNFSGRTYYVRIRAYRTVNGTKYYGKWSEIKTVQSK